LWRIRTLFTMGTKMMYFFPSWIWKFWTDIYCYSHQAWDISNLTTKDVNVSIAICLREVELESKHLTKGCIINDEYSEKSRESDSFSMHSSAPLRTPIGISTIKKITENKYWIIFLWKKNLTRTIKQFYDWWKNQMHIVVQICSKLFDGFQQFARYGSFRTV